MPGSGAPPDQADALLPADPPGASIPAAAAARAGVAATVGQAALRLPRVRPGATTAAASGLIALASGLYKLGVPSLWRDEAATIDAARRPVPHGYG